MSPRSVALVLACAVLLTAAERVRAQGPQLPAAPASPGPSSSTPASATDLVDAWLVIYNVQPARAADFEAVATRVREAMRQSAVPRRRQQAAGLLIHKSALPNPEGNVVYFLQVPTERDNDDDRTGLDVLIESVLPAEATALAARLASALDPRNPSGNTLMLAIR
jgi:hypothetical protein